MFEGSVVSDVRGFAARARESHECTASEAGCVTVVCCEGVPHGGHSCSNFSAAGVVDTVSTTAMPDVHAEGMKQAGAIEQVLHTGLT